jgi:small RNA 2'-O-methyltransferase
MRRADARGGRGHARTASAGLGPEDTPWWGGLPPREPTTLHEARLDAVTDWIRARGARRVADLGCGDGLLVQRLLLEPHIECVVAVDVSMAALGRLERAAAPALARGRRVLVHGSFAVAHRELAAVDTVAMVETLEHVAPAHLSRVEQAVFGHGRPRHVVVTTPNQEYNVLFGMAPGQMREPGHRFEWPRARFRAWATGVALRHGCALELTGIGAADARHGTPTQMAGFISQRMAGAAALDAAGSAQRSSNGLAEQATAAGTMPQP